MKVGRNDPCWCGSGRKYKQCHMAFDQKLDHLASQGHIVPRRDLIKTQEDIVMIREAAKVNRAVLDEVAEKICEGMTASLRRRRPAMALSAPRSTMRAFRTASAPRSTIRSATVFPLRM